jgi:hypothetical protein
MGKIIEIGGGVFQTTGNFRMIIEAKNMEHATQICRDAMGLEEDKNRLQG